MSGEGEQYDRPERDRPERARPRARPADERDAGGEPRRRRPPPEKSANALDILVLILASFGAVLAFLSTSIGAACALVALPLSLVGLAVARGTQKYRTDVPLIGLLVSAVAVGAVVVLVAFFGAPVPFDLDRLGAAPVQLTATELARAYEDDNRDADRKYRRTTVEVTGTVFREAQNMDGLMEMPLAGTNRTDVHCLFSRHSRELRDLVEGQEVTIRGRNRGDSLWVWVEDCEVVRVGPKPQPKPDPLLDPVRPKADPMPDPVPEPRPKPKPKPGAPPIPLTAEELQRAYDDNAIGADAKYRDKVLDLTGPVSRVVRVGLGRARVELSAARGSEIDCEFADNLDALAALVPGDTVVIRGTCRGEDDGTVTLEGCALLKKLPKAALGPATVVALDALRKAYDGNALAADTMYKGKHLEVTGTAIRVAPGRAGTVSLELGTSERFALLCEFAGKGASDGLEKVTVGGTVTVRGVCRSEDGFVRLEQCALVRATGKEPEVAPPPRAKRP